MCHVGGARCAKWVVHTVACVCVCECTHTLRVVRVQDAGPVRVQDAYACMHSRQMPLLAVSNQHLRLATHAHDIPPGDPP